MYKLFIALRYLRANKIIYFSIAGVAVGITVMIIVTSVMGGFSRDLMARIRGMQAHLVIKPRFQDLRILDYEAIVKDVRAVPHVAGAAPRIEYAAWLIFRGSPNTVALMGVDPALEGTASELSRFFANGGKRTFDFRFDDGVGPERAGLVVGSEIPAFESAQVTLRTAITGGTWGTYLPTDDFTVVGRFKSGMAEYDSGYVFMDLDAMQRFLKFDRTVNTIAVEVDDYEKHGDEVRRRVVEAFHPHNPGCRSLRDHAFGQCGSFRVHTWKEARASLLQAVEIERGIQIIILFCIVIVAGFNIIAIYTMMVRAKTRDVGILRSLGATRGGIILVFLLSGGLCGLFGSIFGIAAGTVLATYLNEIVGFVRITSRELNQMAWPSRTFEAGKVWLPLVLYVPALVSLVASWTTLYKPLHSAPRRVWIGAGLAALFFLGGSAAFYAWAPDYKPEYDDPSLTPRLAWWIGGAGAALILGWTLVRLLTDRWHETFAGGLLRVMGTFLYSGLAVAALGPACVSAALLATQPPRQFPGWDLFPRQIYYLDRVPVLIDPGTVIAIVLATLVVGVTFSIYPALRAASFHPIEAIRDE
ncbi:MAG: ABC transporter permease [Planctomycetes bacterium]|nr:ABC transporter permease [Planctomycetota bacterium]